MVISKTSDHIQIKIKMPNPSQVLPASLQAPNEDLKDMDAPCTFKIKTKSKNSDPGYVNNKSLYTNSLISMSFKSSFGASYDPGGY